MDKDKFGLNSGVPGRPGRPGRPGGGGPGGFGPGRPGRPGRPGGFGRPGGGGPGGFGRPGMTRTQSPGFQQAPRPGMAWAGGSTTAAGPPPMQRPGFQPGPWQGGGSGMRPDMLSGIGSMLPQRPGDMRNQPFPGPTGDAPWLTGTRVPQGTGTRLPEWGGDAGANMDFYDMVNRFGQGPDRPGFNRMNDMANRLGQQPVAPTQPGPIGPRDWRNRRADRNQRGMSSREYGQLDRSVGQQDPRSSWFGRGGGQEYIG